MATMGFMDFIKLPEARAQALPVLGSQVPESEWLKTVHAKPSEPSPEIKQPKLGADRDALAKWHKAIEPAKKA